MANTTAHTLKGPERDTGMESIKRLNHAAGAMGLKVVAMDPRTGFLCAVVKHHVSDDIARIGTGCRNLREARQILEAEARQIIEAFEHSLR